MTLETTPYNEFLALKKKVAEKYGFHVDIEDIMINDPLPHQPVITQWTLEQGRALLGLQFGLTKTVIQCAVMKHIWHKEGDPFGNQKLLFVCPLGVKPFFVEDALNHCGIVLQYCTSDAEMDAATNDDFDAAKKALHDFADQKYQVIPSHFTDMNTEEVRATFPKPINEIA